MSLILNRIRFNHDPSSASTSAMNIRRNRDFEVPIPEYDRSVPRPAAQSCAAYAIAETLEQKVFIRVNLTIPASVNKIYEVKASGGGVLGRLDPFKIKFYEGSVSETVDVELSHRQFYKICRHDITWDWYYREQGTTTWLSLVKSSHRIYIVLAVPQSPWNQNTGDKRNPWTDLLDECCMVASGCKKGLPAIKKIAKKINSGYKLRYDVMGGSRRYDFKEKGDSFNLTNWINYVLKGNPPNVPIFCQGTSEEYKHYWIVNCYDCAASLGLMSLVVGVPAEYFLHEPFGYLNYVIPIGRDKCNNPFYGCSGGNPAKGADDQRTLFGNHAYVRFNQGKDFDATMRQWVHPIVLVLAAISWILIFIITLGAVNLKESLLEKANGWLLNLTQAEYEKATIDKSETFESKAAGGSPQIQDLQFKII